MRHTTNRRVGIKSVFLSLLLLFTANFTSADVISISGKVTDKEENKAVQQAKIVILLNGLIQKEVTLNKEGQFSIPNLQENKNYTLQIKAEGYHSWMLQNIKTSFADFVIPLERSSSSNPPENVGATPGGSDVKQQETHNKSDKISDDITFPQDILFCIYFTLILVIVNILLVYFYSDRQRPKTSEYSDIKPSDALNTNNLNILMESVNEIKTNITAFKIEHGASKEKLKKIIENNDNLSNAVNNAILITEKIHNSIEDFQKKNITGESGKSGNMDISHHDPSLSYKERAALSYSKLCEQLSPQIQPCYRGDIFKTMGKTIFSEPTGSHADMMVKSPFILFKENNDKGRIFPNPKCNYVSSMGEIFESLKTDHSEQARKTVSPVEVRRNDSGEWELIYKNQHSVTDTSAKNTDYMEQEGLSMEKLEKIFAEKLGNSLAGKFEEISDEIKNGKEGCLTRQEFKDAIGRLEAAISAKVAEKLSELSVTQNKTGNTEENAGNEKSAGSEEGGTVISHETVAAEKPEKTEGGTDSSSVEPSVTESQNGTGKKNGEKTLTEMQPPSDVMQNTTARF